ncbi:MAG: FkbM family methyltransferase [Akkermansiaceae bacterium]|nr:FkbM family methyltransferase [Armatimonadota bacterium]
MSLITRLADKSIRGILKTRGQEFVIREARNGEMIPLLSLLIEHCTMMEGKGAIVQIGANDGIMEDPVRKSIVSHSLPALLVEPLPNLFEELKKNYSGQPQVRFDNVAVSNEPGEANIFRLRADATQFPEWVHMLASFDKSVILKHKDMDGIRGKNFEQYIEDIPVPVVTVKQLLQRHPDLGNITALQIDTEGHDFIVVKSAVDGDCLPRIINYEHKHLSYGDQTACRDLLAKKGYSFCSTGSDTLAYRMI